MSRPLDDRERRRQELLAELAKRFRESANALKEVARRIHDAARVHQDNTRRLGASGARLRECVESENGTLPFTYLEFLEFTDSQEFKKFKGMSVVSEEEIAQIDWNDLSKKLLGKE
jgi:hypothetical protein